MGTPRAQPHWERWPWALLDLFDSLQFTHLHFLWQPSVGQRLGVILSVRQHPVQEALYGVPLGWILNPRRNQEPSKTRDRIGRLTRRISDGNPEIIGHIARCSGCRSRDARQLSFDEASSSILDSAVGEVILDRVNQFHVADGIRRLLDYSRDAFIAFAPQAHRPVHRRVTADFTFPL